MTLWKKQNHRDSKKISGFWGFGGEGRINRQSTKDFSDSDSLPYDTIMVDTSHYTFVKTHRMYDTYGEP